MLKMPLNANQPTNSEMTYNVRLNSSQKLHLAVR